LVRKKWADCTNTSANGGDNLDLQQAIVEKKRVFEGYLPFRGRQANLLTKRIVRNSCQNKDKRCTIHTYGKGPRRGHGARA